MKRDIHRIYAVELVWARTFEFGIQTDDRAKTGNRVSAYFVRLLFSLIRTYILLPLVELDDRIGLLLVRAHDETLPEKGHVLVLNAFDD